MSQKGIQTCFSKLCLVLPWQNTTTTTQHQWHPANDQCSLHRTSHSINICQFHTKNKTLDSNSCPSAKLHKEEKFRKPSSWNSIEFTHLLLPLLSSAHYNLPASCVLHIHTNWCCIPVCQQTHESKNQHSTIWLLKKKNLKLEAATCPQI